MPAQQRTQQPQHAARQLARGTGKPLRACSPTSRRPGGRGAEQLHAVLRNAQHAPDASGAGMHTCEPGSVRMPHTLVKRPGSRTHQCACQPRAMRVCVALGSGAPSALPNDLLVAPNLAHHLRHLRARAQRMAACPRPSRWQAGRACMHCDTAQPAVQLTHTCNVMAPWAKLASQGCSRCVWSPGVQASDTCGQGDSMDASRMRGSAAQTQTPSAEGTQVPGRPGQQRGQITA